MGQADDTIITSAYWDTETTEQATSAGGEGKSTEEMKKADTYSAWGGMEYCKWRISSVKE